jgi:hypothetical protein
VTALGALDAIHGQGANGIDTQLIQVGLDRNILLRYRLGYRRGLYHDSSQALHTQVCNHGARREENGARPGVESENRSGGANRQRTSAQRHSNKNGAEPVLHAGISAVSLVLLTHREATRLYVGWRIVIKYVEKAG